MSTTSKKLSKVFPKRTSPYTVDFTLEQRQKIRRMIGFCLAEDLEVKNGTIIRTLVENMPEQSTEFRNKVRAQWEKERAITLEKRRQG